MLMPNRIDAPELLDQGVGTAEDVHQNFDDLWRLNRYLGGISVITRHLAPRVPNRCGMMTLVDVGAGSAQLSTAILKWAVQRRSCPLRVIALEIAARNLQVAQQHVVPGVRLIQADALCLPFAPNSVDFVISSLFLHHLTPTQIIDFLQQAYECTRHSLIMADLTRGWLPLAAFKLSQPVFARSYLTRYDGAVSIRRAYTPAEMRKFARCAGLKNFQVYSHSFWRMALVVDK